MSADEQPQADPAASAPPKARTLFRQGAVYGLAGAMKAADVAVAAARGAVRGAREGVDVVDRDDHQLSTEPPEDLPGEPPAAA